MNRLWAPWRMTFIKEAIKGKMKDCVFCRCWKADPAQDRENLVIARGRRVYAIMNRYPYNSGHLMVVPVAHTASLLALDEETRSELEAMTVVAVRAIEATMQPHGLNIGMNLGEAAGAGIKDHLHRHLVPRWSGDTNFMPVFGETKIISEDLFETYARIRGAWSKASSSGSVRA